MNPEEVVVFQDHRHFESAVAERRWDDLARLPKLETPELLLYPPFLEALLVA